MMVVRPAWLAVAWGVAVVAWAADCNSGRATTVDILMEDVPRIPRLDQSIGHARVVLRAAVDGKEITSRQFDGRWSCLAFDEGRGYVLGGIFQQGAWLPLASIQYLDEGGRWQGSAFDRAAHLALAASVSPSGRYIAYVGGAGRVDGLYLLDAEADTLRRLGPAPSPPPADAGLSNLCRGQPFAWGSCWADGYTELDAGCVRFLSDHILEVSYGHDTARRRASKRTVRRFALD